MKKTYLFGMFIIFMVLAVYTLATTEFFDNSNHLGYNVSNISYLDAKYINVTLGNLSIYGANSCVVLPNGKLCSNTTCSTLYSPNGLTTISACN